MIALRGVSLFRPNRVTSFLALLLVFSITYLFVRESKVKANLFDVRAFARECTGGWAKTAEAAGAPSVNKLGRVEFDGMKSAVLSRGTSAELSCGDFRPRGLIDLPVASATAMILWRAEYPGDEPVIVSTSTEGQLTPAEDSATTTLVSTSTEMTSSSTLPTVGGGGAEASSSVDAPQIISAPTTTKETSNPSAPDAGAPADSPVVQPAAPGPSPVSTPEAPAPVSAPSAPASPPSAPTQVSEPSAASTPPAPTSESSPVSLLDYIIYRAHAEEVATSTEVVEASVSAGQAEVVPVEASSLIEQAAEAPIEASTSTSTSTSTEATTSTDVLQDETSTSAIVENVQDVLTPVQREVVAVVRYTTDDGVTWYDLGVLAKEEQGVREFPLPENLIPSLRDARHLRISVANMPLLDNAPILYVDAIWLAADYANGGMAPEYTPPDLGGDDVLIASETVGDITAMLVSRPNQYQDEGLVVSTSTVKTVALTTESTSTQAISTSTGVLVLDAPMASGHNEGGHVSFSVFTPELWLRMGDATSSSWVFVAASSTLSASSTIAINNGHVFWWGEGGVSAYNISSSAYLSQSFAEGANTVLEFSGKSGEIVQAILPVERNIFEFTE